MFYTRGCRVERLHTDTKLAPFGGTTLFIMDGEIVSENEVDMEELRAAVATLENDLGIDLEIEEMSPEDGHNFEQDPLKAVGMGQSLSGAKSTQRADL